MVAGPGCPSFQSPHKSKEYINSMCNDITPESGPIGLQHTVETRLELFD